jgi:hypothetical protein
MVNPTRLETLRDREEGGGGAATRSRPDQGPDCSQSVASPSQVRDIPDARVPDGRHGQTFSLVGRRLDPCDQHPSETSRPLLHGVGRRCESCTAPRNVATSPAAHSLLRMSASARPVRVDAHRSRRRPHRYPRSRLARWEPSAPWTSPSTLTPICSTYSRMSPSSWLCR